MQVLYILLMPHCGRRSWQLQQFFSGVSSRGHHCDDIYGGGRESMKLSECILQPRLATPHNSL